MQKLLTSFIFFIILLAGTACNEKTELETSNYAIVDNPMILNKAEFAGKSAGEIHNLIVLEVLSNTNLSNSMSEKEAYETINTYFQNSYAYSLSTNHFPKSFQTYNDFELLITEFVKYDRNREYDLNFMLGVYNELAKIPSNEDNYIEKLNHEINNYISNIEKGVITVDNKTNVLNGLDVFKHSIQLWLVKDISTRKGRVEDAPCSLYVAGADAIGYIFGGIGGGAAASLITYMNKCI